MKQKLLYILLFVITITQAQTEFLTNRSFETGDLGDWTISEINGTDGSNGSCEKNWAVDTSSLNTCCCIEGEFDPTDGSFGAFTSFDTTVANTQWIIEQAITLPNTINSGSIAFDFVAKFDFGLGAPITIPRDLTVQILSADGSNVISDVFSDEYEGAGLIEVNYTQDVDVSSDLAGLEGTDVILRFTATIAETSTGPGKAMIDNVSFLIDDTLGLDDEIVNNQINVFPNPSNGSFTINYEGNSSLEKGIIYDISGKIVAQLDLSNFSSSRAIETSLSTGVYLLEVQSKLEKQTKKLIIR